MAKEKKGVRLEHISKIYKDPKTGKEFYAVKDTSLNIEPGTFVTLLGPSGCGKTTTLRMIAGFESPDEGEIYLGDQAINELTPNKRDTAMVFQSFALPRSSPHSQSTGPLPRYLLIEGRIPRPCSTSRASTAVAMVLLCC